MAEGFEPCHVPQKSRKDKLRVGAGGGVELASAGFHGFLSPYDHSLLPSDLLSCSAAAGSDQCLLNHRFHPLAAAEEGGGCKSYSVGSLVKEEGGFQSLIPPSSSFLSTHNHHQVSGLDQLPQVAVNPSCSSSIHGSGSSSPFLYAPQTLQNLRDLAHSYNNALSLSLSSHDNNVDNNNRTVDNVAQLELNLQRYGSSATEGLLIPTAISAGGGLTSNEVSRSSVPHGSFAGYSSILKASKFLRPTQQLLEELCDVGRPETVEKIAEADSSLVVDASTIERYLRVEDGSGSVSSCGGDEGEVLRKKSRLISMLEEICRRYKQYYQQMQDAVASFEFVVGFGDAAPFVNLALKAMSKHFRCLKNAVTDQLQLNKDRGNPRKDEGHSRLGIKDGAPYGQRPLLSPGYFNVRQPIWRPQRGLPERAVAVLKAWLFENFLHPYPTDADKVMLAKQTGLSRSQVSNWFINARVRLWKPMVEEIHMLETQQAQKASISQMEDASINSNSSRPVNHQLPLASETPSTSTQRVHETLSNKRSWSDLPKFPTRSDSERPHNLCCDLPSHPGCVSVGEGIGGLNNSVSLTLGLHQSNNGMSLLEPFQVNAVQRFGLGPDGSNEGFGFVLSGYEVQDRRFGRDVFGGQLLHDFAG